jgi:hypothetical protein
MKNRSLTTRKRERASWLLACDTRSVVVDATEAPDGRRPHPGRGTFRLKRNDRQRIAATGREALKGSSKITSATRVERGNEPEGTILWLRRGADSGPCRLDDRNISLDREPLGAYNRSAIRVL